jgi:hypothetical protein
MRSTRLVTNGSDETRPGLGRLLANRGIMNPEPWKGLVELFPGYLPWSTTEGFALAESFSISARPFLARSTSTGLVDRRR